MDAGEQIAVGRGDHAHVDAAVGAIGSHPLDVAGVHEPQKQPLHAGGRFADFVHEHRAAIGLFQLARAVAVRAGEAAAHVTEQLRFEQRFGQRRAVDGDERNAIALAGRVNETRDHFLADAAFARDENLRVAARGILDLAAQRLEGAAQADERNGIVLGR